jgi:hypothetical protein
LGAKSTETPLEQSADFKNRKLKHFSFHLMARLFFFCGDFRLL